MSQEVAAEFGPLWRNHKRHLSVIQDRLQHPYRTSFTVGRINVLLNVRQSHCCVLEGTEQHTLCLFLKTGDQGKQPAALTLSEGD